jgi:2-(1,2-epoxy-1,2-dihydrophenyl)acetyl-CoA isomerase
MSRRWPRTAPWATDDERVTPDRELATGTPELRAQVSRGVGVLEFDRPERRNALSPAILAGFAAVLPELEAAADVGALLVTGAGGAFCAGGDVKSFAERGGATAADVPLEEQIAVRQGQQRAIVGRLYRFPKPTVAALPGAAAGAGIGFALACDLRVGGPTSAFVAAFGAVGLSGDYGAVWLLERIAGPSRARRMLFLNERVDAETALSWGLLDRFVADPVVTGLELAASLAAAPQQALRAIKANLLDAPTLELESAMDVEARRHLECGLSDEHRAAVEAFLQRRR